MQELQDNIRANQNHPSVMMWSIGNELSRAPGPGAGLLHRPRRASGQADGPDAAGRPRRRRLSLAPAARTSTARWTSSGSTTTSAGTRGRGGLVADRALLSPYLDSLRACYPHKAIVVSEFGAEANRDGPPEEKGTFQFQEDFVKYHLGVFATKPWLSGAVYWALKEFRVRPGWDGGNPRPSSPLHQKGLISFADVKKPAYFDLQALYKARRRAVPRPPLGATTRRDPAARPWIASGAGVVRGARSGSWAGRRSRAGRQVGQADGLAQAHARWAGIRQRHAAGARARGLLRARRAAAAAVVLAVGGRRPGRDRVGAQDEQEQHRGEEERDEVERAEEQEQLRIRGHGPRVPRDGAGPEGPFR